MSKEPDLRSLLDLLLRHRRTIAVVAAIAAVLAAVFSGPRFIKPMYRSVATLYPVNLHPYSGETPTEQLLQLFRSNNVRDTLVARFKLDSLYEVDTAKVGGRFHLFKELDARISVSKTVYESVAIEVRDEDPVRARDMATTLLHEVNDLALQLHRKRAREVMVITGSALAEERTKLDSINARLDTLRRSSGLLSYDNQVRELTRGAMQMIAAGTPKQRFDEVRGMLREMEEKGGEFRKLSELSELRLASYSELLDAHERARVDATKLLTFMDVVVHPEADDKKVSPVRWLIVVLSVFAAVFLTTLLLAVRGPRR